MYFAFILLGVEHKKLIRNLEVLLYRVIYGWARIFIQPRKVNFAEIDFNVK